MLTFLPGTADVKSGASSTATVFELRNSTNGAVSLYWIDPQGVERSYGTAQAGGTLIQSTFSGHAWVVRDTNGAPLFKFFATASGLITVSSTSPVFQPNLAGTSGSDSMVGTAGDDRFEPLTGNDTVDGGNGVDLVRLPGGVKDYDIKPGASAGSYVLSSGVHGVKTLISVETIQFASAPNSPLDLTRLAPLLAHEVTPIRRTGDAGGRVDIVFVAEGYTSAQRQQFLDDALRMSESMLGTSNSRLNSPFSPYAGLFNVTAVFVPSAQSGIDEHLKGTKVDTAFDSTTYGADGRLGYGDTSRVSFVLDRAVPSNGRDLVVVLMNTSFYTNAGGAYAWAAASNRFAYDVALHEIGHSYAGLEDEYVDSVLGQGPLPATLSSVHVSLSPTVVPWSRWLGYQDELGTVGAYEGGYYRSTGVWRATPTSKMRENDRPFSAPQKEAFIEQFYKQTGDYLSLAFDGRDGPRAVVPDPLPVGLEWQLQGRVLGTGAQPDLRILTAGTLAVMQTPSAQRLTVASVDNSGMIRDPAILALSRQSESLDVLLGSSTQDRFSGTDKADMVLAGDGDDEISGLVGADILYGHAGRDTLSGGAGSDMLDGGDGLDAARWSGARAQFSLSAGAQSWTVQDLKGDEGSDTLRSVERLIFADTQVALDLGTDQSAGQALLLIGAVIGRQAMLVKRPMMGSIIDLFDQGYTLEVLAGAVMRLPIWAGVLTASDSALDKASHLLTTVHGRTPTAMELSEAVTSLQNETTGALLARLALTAANSQQVGLVGLAQTGFEYPAPTGG
jgi:hypothetical protein